MRACVDTTNVATFSRYTENGAAGLGEGGASGVDTIHVFLSTKTNNWYAKQEIKQGTNMEARKTIKMTYLILKGNGTASAMTSNYFRKYEKCLISLPFPVSSKLRCHLTYASITGNRRNKHSKNMDQLPVNLVTNQQTF